MNEKTDTIEQILEYFKSVNPRWSDITTLIIDKNVCEQGLLAKVFPDAKLSMSTQMSGGKGEADIPGNLLSALRLLMLLRLTCIVSN